MNWTILTQLLSSLLISVLASIVVLRYATSVQNLSKAQVLSLSFGLICIAMVFALGPAILSRFFPAPETLDNIQRKLVSFAIIGTFNVAAIFSLVATLLFVSSNNTRADNLRRLPGPMLAVIGLGVVFAFSCGRVMVGLQELSFAEVLDGMLFPALMAVIAALLSRQWSAEDLPAWRLLASLAVGNCAFGFSMGFIHGYFEGFMNVLRDVPKG